MQPKKPPRGPLLPPVWLFLALLAMVLLHLYFPVLEFGAPGARYVGIALVVAGVAIAGWAAWLFKRSQTGIIPFSPATYLVLGGPYLWTRNPMYVGMALALLGAAVFLASLAPFLVLPLFVLVINNRFILAEEHMLDEAFGEAYREYKAKVRRWL
jgi:protein-S-isoprenylcysteine O-methyltransferase Ste14